MSNSIAFDQAAEYYDQTRAVPPEVEKQGVDAIAAALGLEAGARVLEAGVGTGRWAIPLSRRGYCYHGLDISMPMLRKLVSKQPPVDAPVMLTQGDVTSLPYRDGSFAGVLVVHVFHLVPQYRQAIAEVRRVLQRGGVALAVGDGVVRDDDFQMMVSRKLGEFMAEYGYKHEDVFESWNDVLTTMREGASQLDDYTAFTWETLTTARAAPINLSQRSAGDDEKTLEHIFVRFERWQTVRAILQLATFLVMLWALATTAAALPTGTF